MDRTLSKKEFDSEGPAQRIVEEKRKRRLQLKDHIKVNNK